jgi:RHS repeat-associated protein
VIAPVSREYPRTSGESQISSIDVYQDSATSPGAWTTYYQYIVFTSADGSVTSFFSQNPSVPGMTGSGTSGETSVAAAIHNCNRVGCSALFTTTYYHGDQIGTSRLLTNGQGYPVWQGTFLPYGEEYNPQVTTNHYKFTGKERDSETGLDYFGSRYYSDGFGRWITPDWSANPVPVPYADLNDPQSLNQYSYVRDLPTTQVDQDGHDGGTAAAVWGIFFGGFGGAAEGTAASAASWTLGTILLPAEIGGALGYGAIKSTAENYDTVANAQMGDVIATNKLIMARQVALSQDAQAGSLIKDGKDANKDATATIEAANQAMDAGKYKNPVDVQQHIDKLNKGMEEVVKATEALKNAVGQKARDAAKEALRKAIKEVKGHERDLRTKPQKKPKKNEESGS